MTEATQKATECDAEANATRAEMLSSFNEWYAASFNEPLEEVVPKPPEPVLEPQSADIMDDDEAFEALQLTKVMEENPDMLPYTRARKAMKGRRPTIRQM